MSRNMSRNMIRMFLAAASLGGVAACDKSPVEVTGPASSVLAPSFTSLSAAQKSLSFTENFNPRNPRPDMLEVTGAAPSYATGAAVFAGTNPSGYDRGSLRTIAANYNTTSFRADVTVTIPGGFGGNGIAWFGFGAGEPDCYFYCEPFTDPAIYVRILPSDFFGP